MRELVFLINGNLNQKNVFMKTLILILNLWYYCSYLV